LFGGVGHRRHKHRRRPGQASAQIQDGS